VLVSNLVKDLFHLLFSFGLCLGLNLSHLVNDQIKVCPGYGSLFAFEASGALRQVLSVTIVVPMGGASQRHAEIGHVLA
jgi:hypothetical protein